MSDEWKDHWGTTRGEYVSPRTTLLVYNTRVDMGRELAEYYATVNNVDEDMLCGIDCEAEWYILELWRDGLEDLVCKIKTKILDYLYTNNLLGKVRSILTFKGFPLWWVRGVGTSLECRGAMDWELRTLCEDGDNNSSDYSTRRPNWYWYYCHGEGNGSLRPRRFTASWQYNNGCMFLVSRIDGYTAEHCRQLIDSAHAKLPAGGNAFIDEQGDGSSYDGFLDSLGTTLGELGLTVSKDTDKMRQSFGGASFYAGWYSHYKYSEIRPRFFVPGSVALEVHSASACSFDTDPFPNGSISDPEWPVQGQQPSYAAFYIARGVAATVGATTEPGLLNYTRFDIFGRMLQKGYTVAEAFFAATRDPWQIITEDHQDLGCGNMVLLGDPAYRPFPAKCLV